MLHAHTRTKSIAVVILVLMLASLFTACSSDSAEPFESPLTAAESPLAAPGQTDMAPNVPEPGTETGVLVGRIFSTSLNEYLGVYPVYLGEILPLAPGDDYLITLKEKESPKVETDEQGYVVFSDIPPGEYAIIVWLPFDSAVVPDPNTADKELRVQVVAGEVTDFGTANIEFP